MWTVQARIDDLMKTIRDLINAVAGFSNVPETHLRAATGHQRKFQGIANRSGAVHEQHTTPHPTTDAGHRLYK